MLGRARQLAAPGPLRYGDEAKKHALERGLSPELITGLKCLNRPAEESLLDPHQPPTLPLHMPLFLSL